MLDDLGDIRPVPATNLTHDPLGQVGNRAIDPVLVEAAVSGAERLEVCRNHAENAMDRPEHEEDDEQMVQIPEPLEIRTTGLLDGRTHHHHQCDQHDPAGPGRARQEARTEETNEALAILCG